MKFADLVVMGTSLLQGDTEENIKRALSEMELGLHDAGRILN